MAEKKARSSWFKTIGRLWFNQRVREILWITVFLLMSIGVFAAHYLPATYPVVEGQLSPTTIRAPQTITFEDVKKTAERKRLASENVGDVFATNPAVLEGMEKELALFFQDLYRSVARNNNDTKEKIRILKIDYGLSDVTATVLVSIESETIKILQSEAVNLLRVNWQNVTEADVENRKGSILAQIELLNYNAPYRELLKKAFTRIEMLPNYAKDPEATLKAQQEAARNERPALVTIRKGQKIVDEGEVVTAEQLDIIRSLDSWRSSAPKITLAGLVVLLLLGTFLTILYWRQNRNTFHRTENKAVIMSMVFCFILLLAKLIASLNISPSADTAELVGYLIPVAAGSMLITILLDARLALFLTVFISFFVGILTGNQMSFAITGFMGGLVGIFSISKYSQRMDWAKAGLFISLTNIVTIFAMGLVNNSSWSQIFTGFLLGIINGFFSAVLAYGSLPFFESAFKVTTSVRLLELSNPNQPLLKRLLLEAPGTYHHSILVGNLGEAAADAVGADSLIVRVGALYHDIGKLKRPYFFIENQLGGENPHEQLTPAISSLIITAHLKDGLELAQQNRLPPMVTELIAQHHGTSLVSYFYHKALEMGNADTVAESAFRYDAPKPQSKEAAILMLADSVEAAVRSLTDATTERIEVMVRKIVKERVQDGQMDESALTFKDTELIAQAFVRILNGIFHTRIEYPEIVLEAMKGGDGLDEHPNRKSATPDKNQQGDPGVGA